MPHLTFARHLSLKYRARVRKIPLDAGFTCPNRDGAISTSGCVFCNAQGSGSGLLARGLDIAAQYAELVKAYRRRYKAEYFLAYFQSFTNTYGPSAKVSTLIDSVRNLPDLIGLGIGTRPDCLDRTKAEIIASAGLPETWLELGLQSANDATLVRINRGHTAADFARSATLAHSVGLQVCAHVMVGLPGETQTDFLRTVAFLNDLPVNGIKLHNLYVARGTTLARWFAQGAYVPPDRAMYIETVVKTLDMLRPDIIIHRLSADPAPGELLAPAWAAEKNPLTRDLRQALGWPKVN